VLFTEPTFLFLFLPLLLGLCFLPGAWRTIREGVSSHAAYANGLLLAASIVFYAKGGGSFTWLMLGSIAFNYWMAIRVDRVHAHSHARARTLAGIAVATNLIVLGWFKYANFLSENVNAVLGFAGAPPFELPNVVLPIGISFFSFHAISYVVDVSRRDAVAQKSPVHAALYLLLFPQLIAGPIIRYRDIADQLARRIVSLEDFAEGIRRFIIGLGKKVLIANVVGGPADRIFGMPAAQLDAGHAWLGVVCYTLQIYFDFSGYSDMAIGLGRMFGFRFPENFRWPYVADTIQEFWRRWHISLSSWFRDYLYVPLGGNRASPARVYLNLVTVFFLCGLWHGASWNFVIWGLFHGSFLVVERLGLAAALGRVWAPIRHVYVLVVVMVGWVFFRADTLQGAAAFLEAMAGMGGAAPTPLTLGFYLTPELLLALAAGVTGAVPILPVLHRWRQSLPGQWPAFGLDTFGTAVLMVIFVASVMQVAANTYNPFIYFRF
jgi:alginate O-acetyltransferase complex protein AlgI